jgi:RNA polymerase sporulation-specific sigma factor
VIFQAQREVLDGYQALVDEDVVEYAREGDDAALEYLINKYKNFVRAKARSYFLIGADREDIIQEGMIGLYKAIRDFRLDKLSSFRAFAELCITRQIITAIKTATRQKHIPLNSYVSLNKPIYDEDSDRTLLDVLSGSKITDPEELIISREEFDDIEEKMGEILSSLEWKVLMSYLEGKSYQEIAEDLQPSLANINCRKPRTVVMGLRISWPMPAAISPTRFIRSNRAISFSICLRLVISLTVATMQSLPLIVARFILTSTQKNRPSLFLALHSKSGDSPFAAFFSQY